MSRQQLQQNIDNLKVYLNRADIRDILDERRIAVQFRKIEREIELLQKKVEIVRQKRGNQRGG